MLLCGVVAATSPSHAAAASSYEICVVPAGATQPAGCSQVVTTLSAAQAAVEANNSSQNVVVELATATYTVTQPLTFGSADGGQNGYYVTWEAAPGATPVISGGEQVTGWTLDSGSIYQANVGVGTNTRNLYVNGVEAPVAGSPLAGSAAASLATVTNTGFTVTNSTLKTELNAATDVTQMEIEHRGTWTDHYCPVSSISNSGGTITMAQPCWNNNIMGWDTGDSTSGDYIENNLTFLNEASEFYLDSATGVLYYYAPSGTTLAGMNSQNVALPLVQSIVTISGTDANPAENLTFQGIEFENSSWLLPSTPGGYADQQQNYFSYLNYATTLTTANGYPSNYSYPASPGTSTSGPFEATRHLWYEVPGAIQVSAANGVTFAGDTFTDLGSAALGIGEDAEDMTSGVPYDAQNITVANNTFNQIAATGVMIGGINYPAASAPANPAYNNANVVVENNTLTALGTNYLDSDGVEDNNTTHAVITNNYIHNAPYDGIATGFGWGAFDPGGSEDYNSRGTYTSSYYPTGTQIVPTTATPQEYTVITNNNISDTGLGTASFSCCAGPFYNLSADPFGVFTGNYMYANNPGQGGLYEDEGSRFNTYYDNVIQGATSWAGVNSSSINNADDNLFYQNWHNNSATVNSTTGQGSPHYNVVFANPLIAGTTWPSAAAQVISNSGLVSGLGYPAPTITTLGQATMTVGSSGSYTAFASGAPTPSFVETGALPSGVAFTDNGTGSATLAGTPAAGTAGTYPISITASNGSGNAATQSFTLTVLAQSPTSTTEIIAGLVTSASTGLPIANVCAYLYTNPTTATAGTALASACTTASGAYEMDGVVPAPLQAVNTLDSSHYLVKFVDPSGTDTTTWYNGTPNGAQTEATANAIQLEGRLNTAITGINAVMPVNQAPSITSAASLTAVVSTPTTFIMRASGSPWATFAETGALPSGVTLTSEGDGTAVLSGTPASTSAGTYVLTVTASNGITPNATQTFTLTVLGAAPSPTGSTLTGLATNASTGSGLANICAYLYPVGNSTSASYATCTQSSGSYEFDGVTPGSYDVAFAASSGAYATQWYNGTVGGAASQSGATAVTLTAGTATTGVSAAMSASTQGNVSGTVTSAATQAGLANMCVYLYPVGNSTTASYATCTVYNGSYAIAGVAAGSYDVAFTDPTGTYVTQWYTGSAGGAASQSGAVAVSVPGGNQTASGINAALAQAPQGTISGTVTSAATQAGLANMCVYLYPVGNSTTASYATCTLYNGSYAIAGVASGSYDVAFADPAGTYVTQWYTGSAGGAASQSGAVAVIVPSGNQTVSGINAALAQVAQGNISGTVTSAATQNGLANMCVYLYPVGNSTTASYATCTPAGGSYAIAGVASGSYDVAFADPAGKYATQWYTGSAGGASSQSGAVAVTVPTGNQTASGINAALAQVAQGNISGTVTSAATQNGLANMCVYLYPVGNSTTASYATCTPAGGSYTIAGVASGSYDVAFADPAATYATQWYNGSTGGASSQSGAVSVTVPSGNQTVSGINAAMFSYLKSPVTGTVTNAATQNGLANMCVYLYTVGNSTTAAYATCTASDGTYTLGAVAEGTYDVAFADPTGAYATQWYNGSAGGASSQSAAQPVSVPGGNQAVSGINAAMSLVQKGNMTGTVTTGSGPLANICVYVYAVGNSSSASYAACTSSTGTYTISGMVPGSYDVAFYDPNGNYITQWYTGTSGGASSQSGATAVVIAGGNATTAGVNASMSHT
jgi:hypothetical protein